jgi:hypothetical protein
MTSVNLVKFTRVIGKCKDCPSACNLYESGWNIPDECRFAKATEEEYEKEIW